MVSVFSIQFRSFDLTAIVDTLAMLIGIVALSSRNRLYLFFVSSGVDVDRIGGFRHSSKPRISFFVSYLFSCCTYGTVVHVM